MPPFSNVLPAFVPPSTDAGRTEAAKRLLDNEATLRRLSSDLDGLFDAFLSAHHLLFRRGRLPATGVDPASISQGRRLVRRAIKLGFLRQEPPAIDTFSISPQAATTECAALCVSLDRIVRHLVLQGDHVHTQLLWDAACTRDTLNRKARSLHLVQTVRDRWDRTFASLHDVTRAALRLRQRESELSLFFFDADALRPLDGVKPHTSRDTVADDEDNVVGLSPKAANEDGRSHDVTTLQRKQSTKA